ncbi:uncharacterized protein LOC130677078 [Microplitis mediator]|uniref:uncharacterized protein LOC130677078 n=1 Tax=Microplitis mediator TaxID=375433 RepID=UPI002553870B|nr:uncharacterized protein LOC130677078 [Microplitis mediator]XP_057339648.1 uncharacterized protein LOC130677078 [Microplitis mediator]XP_057339649.1 uncharacterized protein LOC130677078 [Microplitis mediator]XP_057339650.1 uncharacterized protein LOC130677078 [Microplitis mediator]
MSEIEHQSVSPVPSQPVTTLTIQPSAYRILRSPSHESVTTDLSLFSVSSITSNIKSSNRITALKSFSDIHLSDRRSSPNPDARDSEKNRPADIPEILWFEEETELIRSCAALSSALGLSKSFSTSDVSQLPSPEVSCPQVLRLAVSALALNSAHCDRFLIEQAHLDHASRSCSTWVAVGDIAGTSQLPSPHGGTSQQISASLHPQPIPFTAADLVRSVNKKVRQNYIRRRLLTTYRALERLSQSEFNLDRLEAVASAAQTTSGVTLVVPATGSNIDRSTILSGKTSDHPLTVSDVERESGKQLTKYERNMMIFNWLHNLDDNPDENLSTASEIKVLND